MNKDQKNNELETIYIKNVNGIIEQVIPSEKLIKQIRRDTKRLSKKYSKMYLYTLIYYLQMEIKKE